MTNPISGRILQAVTAPAKPTPVPTPADKAIEWTQLDPDTLSPDLRKAYDEYRAAAKAAAILLYPSRTISPARLDKPQSNAI